MELKVAKQVISEALNIAIMKGCFGLLEVQNIVEALKALEEQPEIEFGEIHPVESN